MLSNHPVFVRAVLGIGFAVAASLIALVQPISAAEPPSLEGSWSGGGTVHFQTGGSENARCKARFRPSGNHVSMSASCATPSYKIDQTALLKRTSGNRYSGSFHNAEYNIDGDIQISVDGNYLRASLNGGGGSAQFNLHR